MDGAAAARTTGTPETKPQQAADRDRARGRRGRPDRLRACERDRLRERAAATVHLARAPDPARCTTVALARPCRRPDGIDLDELRSRRRDRYLRRLDASRRET